MKSFITIAAILLVAGCATTRDVDNAKAEALAAAATAQTTAEAAQKCCDEQTERMSRMWTKIMSK